MNALVITKNMFWWNVGLNSTYSVYIHIIIIQLKFSISVLHLVDLWQASKYIIDLYILLHHLLWRILLGG